MQTQNAQLRKTQTRSEKWDAHFRKVLAQFVQAIGPHAKGWVITSAPASGSEKGKERQEKGEGRSGGKQRTEEGDSDEF